MKPPAGTRVTTDEAAEILGRDRDAVMRLARSGELRSTTRGRAPRHFLLRDVLALRDRFDDGESQASILKMMMQGPDASDINIVMVTKKSLSFVAAIRARYEAAFDEFLRRQQQKDVDAALSERRAEIERVLAYFFEPRSRQPGVYLESERDCVARALVNLRRNSSLSFELAAIRLMVAIEGARILRETGEGPLMADARWQLSQVTREVDRLALLAVNEGYRLDVAPEPRWLVPPPPKLRAVREAEKAADRARAEKVKQADAALARAREAEEASRPERERRRAEAGARARASELAAHAPAAE